MTSKIPKRVELHFKDDIELEIKKKKKEKKKLTKQIKQLGIVKNEINNE